MFANLHTIHLKTPIGIMQAVATDESICLLEFDTRPELAQEISFLKAHFNAELIEAENAPLHTLKK